MRHPRREASLCQVVVLVANEGLGCGRHISACWSSSSYCRESVTVALRLSRPNNFRVQATVLLVVLVEVPSSN